MPNYNDLRPDADFEERDFERVFPEMTPPERVRCIDGLLRLKAGLAEDVPARRTEANLLVASWNIRGFGTSKQRLAEAYFYIAEVLACFDLIAIQEVKTSLLKLDKVMRLLGDDWRYLVNDVTEGDAGNDERSAYVYNTKRVALSGLAGEIALWKDLTADSPIGLDQLSRAPFMTGFIAGWKKFALVNLHLEPNDTRASVEVRSEEVRLLLAALEKKRKGLWSDNLVLVGDMNFYAAKDAANIAALGQAGYVECASLLGKPTNVHLAGSGGVVETYDRMFFRANDYFRFAKARDGNQSGGVFDPFSYVYRSADVMTYRAEMLKVYGGSKDLAGDDGLLGESFHDHWRENQLSDHWPIWVELVIDNSTEFLAQKRGEMPVG
jgi:endonuclease/exonuclease/phosphatase family metal-dependent hydrolase